MTRISAGMLNTGADMTRISVGMLNTGADMTKISDHTWYKQTAKTAISADPDAI